MVLFVFLAAREIDRPFYGLHGWDQAIMAWIARSHVEYGLRYTKGLVTLAVGNPPPAIPPWYLDHPQLPHLLDAAATLIFGVNETAVRLAALIVTALSLPFLIALLRRLYGDEAAILTTLLYIVFPITSYFNSAWQQYPVLPFVLLAYWCYLRRLGDLGESPAPGKHYLVGLGIALFILPQLNWAGFFFCAAIGSDYLLRCLVNRTRPERRLLSTLVLSSLFGALMDLGVLVYGRGGNYRSLIGLYAFRSHVTSTLSPDRTRLAWFARQWDMVQSNFTLPVVLIVVAYLAYRAASRVRAYRASAELSGHPGSMSRVFTHAWILVVPGILTMVVLPELFWVHQFAYKWLSLPVAIMAALGILQLRDKLLLRSRRLANAVILGIVAVIGGYAARGINYYYTIRQQSPVEIEIFKKLNAEIAPDKRLLTYADYVSQDDPNKIAHLRPEVAWYLDREMDVAMTMNDVDSSAATGKYPFYLVDVKLAQPELVEKLKAKYPFEFVQGNAYQEKPLIAGLDDQLIFDLRPQGAALKNSAVAYNNLGWALQQQGKLDEAIKDYELALKYDPGLNLARNNLAAALRSKGK